MDSVDCAFTPSPTDWSIRLDAIVGANPSGDSICTLINPLVGDLDGDGIPEIVCFSTRNYNNTAFQGGGNPGSRVKNVVVYDGRSLQRKAKFDLPSYVSAFEATPFGLAKPYGGDALMVFACVDNKLYAYKLDGSGGATQVWGGVSYGSGNDYATVVGFADFNNDSIPEVYVRNKIFNLVSGQLLLTVSSSNQGSTYAHVGNSSASSRKPLAASFAADIVGDGKCELLLGNEIHSITITNPNGTAGNSSTLYATAPSTGVSGIGTDGHAQVADFNLDGHLDVFLSSRPGQVNSATIYGYVWDVFNNTVSTPIAQSVTLPGKSIPLIADIDNDGTPEVVLHVAVAGSNVRAYKYNAAARTFSLFWTKGFSEDSYSNSLTLFDFNQDGENELLICDNDSIKIVNGSTPALAQRTISSLGFREVTIMQYPIIADIDNDGAAEIVFVGKQNSQSYQGTLNICRSNGDPWAPARPVWNQYMYNITNVNQDLTIPVSIFNNATAFTDPDSGVVRRPFNNFLQQATSVDLYGRPYYTAADLQSGASSVTLTATGAHLVFDICNVGTSIFSADTLYTQIYIGQYGGTLMRKIVAFGDAGLPLQILPDSCRTIDVVIPYSILCPYMPFDTLALAINDIGMGVAEGGLPPECNITNNVFTLANDILIQRDTINDSVCRGAPYNRNGFVVSTDTTSVLGLHVIVDTVPDAMYCQRIRTLRLMVIDGFSDDTMAHACDSMLWHGVMRTVSGDYVDSLVATSGCDSVVTLHLTVDSNYSSEMTAEACDSFSWQDSTYTSTDTVSHTFASVAGCDSVVTLYLTITPSYDFDTTDQACGSYTWDATHTYNQSGDYVISNTTASGCDSVWTIHLTIHTDTLIINTYEGCDSVDVSGVVYRADTVLVDSLTSVHGCDSVIQYQIIVHPIYNDTVVDSLPYGAIYTFNGHDYTDSGVYTLPLLSIYGCDSVTTLMLSVYDLCSVFLQFPNLVTPNGDGVNDRFVIQNLVDEDCYPINHLTIYNRWGVRVYDAENITQDSEFWDPAKNNAPAGTYFFIFRGKGHKGRMERRGAIEVIH